MDKGAGGKRPGSRDIITGKDNGQSIADPIVPEISFTVDTPGRVFRKERGRVFRKERRTPGTSLINCYCIMCTVHCNLMS